MGPTKPKAGLLADESGQAFTEYILLLTVAVVGAGALGRAILKVFDEGVLKIGSFLEKDLKTGRIPADVWKSN